LPGAGTVNAASPDSSREPFTGVTCTAVHPVRKTSPSEAPAGGGGNACSKVKTKCFACTPPLAGTTSSHTSVSFAQTSAAAFSFPASSGFWRCVYFARIETWTFVPGGTFFAIRHVIWSCRAGAAGSSAGAAGATPRSAQARTMRARVMNTPPPSRLTRSAPSRET
jgi:hypothetical protein